MEAPLAHTPLYEWHVAHGARMVGFAGWAMPLQYTSIIDEHVATRSAAGITDISHMGRLRFEGPGAAVFLAELLTRRVADMELGQIRYSLVTNDRGGILDDVLVGYYRNAHGQPFYLLVVNACNRQKIVHWVQAHLPPERAEAPGAGSDLHRREPSVGDVRHPRAAERGDPPAADRRWTCASMRYYRGGLVQILASGRPAAGRHDQPHRLHGRRRLRAERRQPTSPWASGRRSSTWAGRWGWCPPGWAPATRCGWRPACRCMATS